MHWKCMWLSKTLFFKYLDFKRFWQCFSRRLVENTGYSQVKTWRIFINCLLVTHYHEHSSGPVISRILPLTQRLSDIFAQIELSFFSGLHATVGSFLPIPCCHFSVFSSISQCFCLPNNGVLWWFLCLTCLWSLSFNLAVSMWFGWLSITLLYRLVP